jgi:copper chaperone CopZ
MATYLHALDGRIRVRLPRVRDDRRAAARLRQTLRGLDGVTTATANPLTGSVLVEYDSERCSAGAIFDALDVVPPAQPGKTGPLLTPASSGRRDGVRDVVAETLLQFAAERLLMAVIT